MNRRNFLGMMVGGIAASAAVRTWPFRVYSFPGEIVLANSIPAAMVLNRSAWQSEPIVGQTVQLINWNLRIKEVGKYAVLVERA